MGTRVSSPELVGRNRELAELQSLLGETPTSGARTVLLAGEAGIGKTRLSDALATRARADGVRVLAGHCIDLGDSALPFAAIIDAFRALARLEGPAELSRLLGRAHHELATIVPGLTAGSAPAPPASAGREDGRYAIATLDAIEHLARRDPVLLLIEDAHWADSATVRVIDYLARSLGDAPVLLAVTFRSDELDPAHPWATVLGELSRLPNVDRLDLAPFGPDEVGAQITGILGHRVDPAIVADISARSGGNAFFVEELVACQQELDADGALPPALRDVIRGRLLSLPQETRDLLGSVAVAGAQVDSALLDAMADASAPRLDEHLRPAVGRGVLLVGGSGVYGFRHALVREVVLDGLLPGERAELHRQVATALEARPELAAGGPDEIHAELAHHWQMARVPEQALAASLAASERANELGAFAVALRHHERALSLLREVSLDDGPDPVHLHTMAAKLAHAAGEVSTSVEHWRAALHLHPEMSPEAEADARSRLARSLAETGDLDGALVEARTARDLIAGGRPSRIKAGVLATYAGLCLWLPHEDTEAALAPAREAVVAAQAAGDHQAEARVRQILGTALSWVGEFDEAVHHLRTGLDLARELGDVYTTKNAYVTLALTLHRSDIARGSFDVLPLGEEILAWLDEVGHDLPKLPDVLEFVGFAFLRSGDWHRVDDLIERMRGSYLEGVTLAYHHLVVAMAHWMRGELDEAQDRIEEIRDVGWLGRGYQIAPLDAEVAAAQGRLPHLRETVDRHVAQPSEPTEEILKVASLRALVRGEVDAALRASDSDAADHLARAHAAMARIGELMADFPLTAGTQQIEPPETYRLLARAELTRATGADPQAWSAAADATTTTYWRCYARGRLAEALLEVSDEGADDELCGAHQQANSLGAAELRAGIESVARRHGIRLAGMRVQDATELGLTPRESEILVLVAAGHSNREIGERLFISPKTVSVHLSNVFTKLGLDSREAAAALAKEVGLGPPGSPD